MDTISLALHRLPFAGRLVRPRLKSGTHRRDEEYQARELTTTVGILDAEGVDGAFIWTFADPWMTHSTGPRHDIGDRAHASSPRRSRARLLGH